MTHMNIQKCLYTALKVPKSVFEKSSQVYLSDVESRKVYESELQNTYMTTKGRTPNELTREQCLDAVRKLELAKFESHKKVFEIMKKQRMPPQMMH